MRSKQVYWVFTVTVESERCADAEQLRVVPLEDRPLTGRAKVCSAP
jgi:hypothetical protein